MGNPSRNFERRHRHSVFIRGISAYEIYFAPGIITKSPRLLTRAARTRSTFITGFGTTCSIASKKEDSGAWRKTFTALCGRQSIVELKYCPSKKFMIYLKKKPENHFDAQALLSASKDAFYRIKSAYSNETATLGRC